MTPALSICLPVYNGERYLQAAIESALQQGFGDFELVICDDASTDHTVELCRSIKDPRLRLIEAHENLGLAGNWNRCIAACRGALLKYLAQDDLLLPGALESFLFHQSLYPDQSFFFCSNEQIDEDGATVRFRKPPLAHPLQSPDQLLRLLFEHGNQIGGPTNTLIRTAAIEEVGWFDARSSYSLDWVLWVQLARRFGGVYLDRPLVQIREHRGSETSRLARGDAGSGDLRWWDGYRALQILRDREPSLGPWLRRARHDFLLGMPRHALREAVRTRGLPPGLFGRALELLRDSGW